MHNTAKATIHLGAIAHNLDQARKLAPESRVLAVIKADAYGHGLLEVASALDKYDGLAVARLDEALRLRKKIDSRRVVLLGSLLTEPELHLCSSNQIDIVVHNRETAQTLEQVILQKPLNVWLKIDSGMHRLGLLPDEFNEVAESLAQSPNVAEITCMTHFSAADEADPRITERQTACFETTVADDTLPCSLANSAAILQHPHTHRDWIRPGIMLYGADPLEQPNDQVQLLPAMTLSSQVLAIRQLKTGETVGYNQTWQASQDVTIATIGIGYGDGYPRHAPTGTPTLIHGQRAPLVGRVSMDLITVDISHITDVCVGDEVILWGDHGLRVEEVADFSGTISYELLTSVTQRVTRQYLKNSAQELL